MLTNGNLTSLKEELKMKVEQMRGRNGNAVPNQLIIQDEIDELSGNCIEYFQSYQTIIAKRDKFRAGVTSRQVWLDRDKWNYSRTTGKYRNMFLGETTAETEQKIQSGEYLLEDLNK
jgi:hypothetical protein